MRVLLPVVRSHTRCLGWFRSPDRVLMPQVRLGPRTAELGWRFYTNQLSMKSSGQTVGTEEAPKASLPPSDVMRSNPADPIHSGMSGREGQIIPPTDLHPCFIVSIVNFHMLTHVCPDVTIRNNAFSNVRIRMD